jgi:hypothetical protein
MLDRARTTLTLLLALAATPLAAQDYEALLQDARSMPLHEVDFAALREAYARSPQYDAMSDLKEMVALPTLAGAGQGERPPLRVSELEEAVDREYPLLETHYFAYLFYGSLPRPNVRAQMIHQNIYDRLLDSVLATAVRTPGEPVTYKVLTVGEEYLVLDALGLESELQSLVFMDEVPYDIHETAEGAVRFDISSFFGRN